MVLHLERIRLIRMNRDFLVLERSISVECALVVGCVALLLGMGMEGRVEEHRCRADNRIFMQ
jgi:hypothetical protein